MIFLQWTALLFFFALAGGLSLFFGDTPSLPEANTDGVLVIPSERESYVPPPVSVEAVASERPPIVPSVEAPEPESSPLVVPSPVLPAVSVSEPLPSPIEPVEDLSTTIGLLRASLVNLICIPEDDSLRSVSGTGIMIDSRGIILTVAHVGQYFLLRDQGREDIFCVVRTGSPAKNAYEAELAYLSPQWVVENPDTLSASHPTGTGEYDFALLAISGSATNDPLPSFFPSVDLAGDTDRITPKDSVSVGSYGAEFLTSSQVRSYLYPSIVFGDIDDIYTFDTTTLDLFSVAVGASAQQGSSGGGVLNEDDELIGLITTRTSRADLSLRALNVITLDHIRRAFAEDTDDEFDSYLENRSPAALVHFFEPRASVLAEILEDAIEN